MVKVCSHNFFGRRFIHSAGTKSDEGYTIKLSLNIASAVVPSEWIVIRGAVASRLFTSRTKSGLVAQLCSTDLPLGVVDGVVTAVGASGMSVLPLLLHPRLTMINVAAEPNKALLVLVVLEVVLTET